MSALDPLTDEQREVRELVRAFARERIAPRAAEIDASGEFPWDVVELFRENDLFGMMFDEEYGGIGASALLTLVTVEELSKVCATSGLIIATNHPSMLDALLINSPGNGQALWERGQLELERNRPTAAESWLRKAVRALPHDRGPNFSLYRCLLELEDGAG